MKEVKQNNPATSGLDPNVKLPKIHLRMPKAKLSKTDSTTKWTVISVTTFSLIILAVLIVFIIYKAVPALHDYGFFKFIFGANWAPGKNGATDAHYGILKIIASTLMMLFIALLFAIPLTIFSSLFISEYLTPKVKNFVIVIIQLLAGIPSVVFGLFALDQIGPIFVKMGAATNGNMMTASFTLAFMALPTMITLSVNAIESVPDSYRFASLGLGITKERTTFAIVLKSATPKIITAIITGMARIIGETMAVILIAGNSTKGLDTSDGFVGFIFSSIRTLAGTIGLEMLENYGTVHESALYTIGLVLFILVILINLIIIAITNQSRRKTRRLKTLKHHRKNRLKTPNYTYEPYKLKALVQTSADKRTKKTIESFLLRFFMMSSTAIIVAFTSWIILGVTIKGIAGFDASAFIQIEGQRSGIFATLFVTILLIVNTLMFALPLSLVVAIYLAEYAHQQSKFAKTIRFGINVLSSTPSIVFGVFGLSFFIVLLKIPMSVFAASLTMTIVVLPPLITSFEDALTSVPDSYREAAYGMGLNKTMVILKVVLPNAMQGIVTGTILATARIIGEAAPVYLTLGTAVRLPAEGFFSSGATLTTQIYMMAAEGSDPHVLGVAYQIALVTLFLVLGLNWFSSYVAHRLSPAYKKVNFKTYWANKYKKIMKHNYKQDFVLLGKVFKNSGLKFVNIFNVKRWKILVANSKTRRQVIKNIIGEAKKNGTKTSKRAK